MKKTLQIAVAGALLSLGMAAANAASYTLTSTPIVDITHATSSSGLSFAAFDTSLGTLQSVTFTFTSTIDGSATAVNTASDAVLTTVGSGAALTLNVAGLSSPLTVNTVYYGTLNLAANPSHAVDFPALQGPTSGLPSYAGRVTFSGETVSASATVTDLSIFTNPSGITASASGLFIGSGTGNVGYFGTSTVSTVASLTYNYAPVPEPETYGMLLAGLGLMGAIARRKAKKAA